MSTMVLAALLLTTWACSDDTDASGGENPEEASLYHSDHCRTEWCGGDKGLRSDGGY